MLYGFKSFESESRLRSAVKIRNLLHDFQIIFELWWHLSDLYVALLPDLYMVLPLPEEIANYLRVATQFQEH